MKSHMCSEKPRQSTQIDAQNQIMALFLRRLDVSGRKSRLRRNQHSVPDGTSADYLEEIKLNLRAQFSVRIPQQPRSGCFFALRCLAPQKLGHNNASEEGACDDTVLAGENRGKADIRDHSRYVCPMSAATTLPVSLLVSDHSPRRILAKVKCAVG